jgi:PAS domain S-box-containing protein
MSASLRGKNMTAASVFPLWGLISTIVASLLGGGLIGRWLQYKLSNRKIDGEQAHQAAEDKKEAREQGRLDFETLLRVVTGQRDEAFATIKDHDAKFLALEMEVQGLRLARDLDPFPNWIVDLEGNYIFVNQEFEKTFLAPAKLGYRDMIGQKHEKIFPAEFSEKLRQLARRSVARPDKQARMTTTLDGKTITVHKFPICVRGAAVAYAGYVTEMEGMGE